MPSQDMCPLNPSLRVVECAHCQGLERITRDNPRFSLKEDYFNGFPIVEVLKNGGPVHLWDEHFRFGQRKAEMLVACMAILRDFWRSTDDERRAFKPRLIENQRRGLRVQIYIEMHPDFERSTGSTIERPWLCLRALPPDNDHLGLGLMKCRAVCAVEQVLRHWLRKQGVPD
jgi:hypothetical protein